MNAWPPNPYLHDWLRTPEGQEYLQNNGSLDAYRNHPNTLGAGGLPIVADPAVPEDSMFFIGQPKISDTTEQNARRNAVVTNINWNF